MRVLHINSNYIYTALHQNMIIALNKKGITNSVFVPVSNPDNGNVKPIDNVRVVKCFNKADRFIFHLKQKKIFKALSKCCKIDSYDCIHAYTLFTDGYCAMKASKEYGKPYVVAVRNTDVNIFLKYMPYLRKTGIRVLERADKVFFLSDTYKKQVIEKYVPEKLKEALIKKSIIIPNGIDEFWLANSYSHKDISASLTRFDNQILRLIYAGSVDKNKNITLTINAMKLLKKQGWKVTLEIIGPINDQTVFKEISKNTDVTYTKKLPKEELIKKYREADIFVMPSHTESFGLVYAEAMSQGLPVLYTAGQGFDGQFEDGLVGYAVSDTNPKELAEALCRCVSNYKHLYNNSLTAVKKFDWSIISSDYSAVYKGITMQ